MMANHFVNAVARRNYLLACVVVFFLFTTTSTLALLSVILSIHQYNQTEISHILSSPIVPVIASLLIAGRAIQRFGPLFIMLLGAALTVSGFIAFDVAIFSFSGSIACRSIIGFGFGFVFSASMVFVRNLLVGPSITYYFGIFSSLIPLPNAFAPSLGEWYLKHFGSDYFFLWMSIPSIIGLLALVYLVLRNNDAKMKMTSTSYLSHGKILKNRNFLPPAIAILAVGLIWGFSVSYVALYLMDRNIPVGLFFMPLSLVLFSSRFGFLALLQRLERSFLVAMAFAGMSLSYGILLFLENSATCVLAGLIFGFGYSLAFPTLSVWVSSEFSMDERPVVMSLFNAFFHTGMFVMPLFAGIFSGIRLSALVLGLTALGSVITFIFFCIAGKQVNFRSSK